ncbi:hypothetical protein VTJ49DRAFT_4289 [Mycothermus thermophilus]|uniref:Protein kinase domain-containing protein n=1 Tax=Humicola insolens TaxID=85995 RepID=A0ABR3V696_HUMIN
MDAMDLDSGPGHSHQADNQPPQTNPPQPQAQPGPSNAPVQNQGMPQQIGGVNPFQNPLQSNPYHALADPRGFVPINQPGQNLFASQQQPSQNPFLPQQPGGNAQQAGGLNQRQQTGSANPANPQGFVPINRARQNPALPQQPGGIPQQGGANPPNPQGFVPINQPRQNPVPAQQPGGNVQQAGGLNPQQQAALLDALNQQLAGAAPAQPPGQPQPPPFNESNEAHKLLREWNVRFSRYRDTGERVHYPLDPDEVNHWQVPFPGEYRLQRTGATNSPPIARIYGTWAADKTPSFRDEVTQAVEQRVEPKLEARNLQLKRIVGAGGNGIAALFETRQPLNGRIQKFIVKCNIRDTPHDTAQLLKEKNLTAKFADCMHIVRLIEDELLPPPHDPDEQDPDEPGSDERGDVSNLMILEYYPRGSLAKGLCNIVRAAHTTNLNKRTVRRFETRQLYHVFLCLVKSLIACCYPPVDNEDLYEDEEPPLQEKCPERGTRRKWQLVHFDIDPMNILVGDSDPHTGHGIMPCMKLSDFGLAKDWPEMRQKEKFAPLLWRRMAKHRFYCSEQFTGEWNYVWPGAEPENAFGPGKPSRIAGQYDWRSNLFQFGLVMLVLVTGCSPPNPPHVSKVWVPRKKGYWDDDDDEVHARQPPRDREGDAEYEHGPEGKDIDSCLYDGPEANNPGEYIRVWSWGGYILQDDENLDYHKIDRELRILVAWCLADDPYYRPRLRVLERMLIARMEKLNIVDETRLNKTKPGRSKKDKELQRWVDIVFDKPGSYWVTE